MSPHKNRRRARDAKYARFVEFEQPGPEPKPFLRNERFHYGIGFTQGGNVARVVVSERLDDGSVVIRKIWPAVPFNPDGSISLPPRERTET